MNWGFERFTGLIVMGYCIIVLAIVAAKYGNGTAKLRKAKYLLDVPIFGFRNPCATGRNASSQQQQHTQAQAHSSSSRAEFGARREHSSRLNWL